MTSLAEHFSAYLDRGEIKYEQDDERDLFRMLFDGKHGDIRVLIVVEDDMIQAFTHPPNKVADQFRDVMTQAITRANYGLKLGKFEMDLDDGELRYQAALPLAENDFPADEVLDHILYVGGAMVDRYLPAFLAIIYGNEDVKLAIDAVEM